MGKNGKQTEELNQAEKSPNVLGRMETTKVEDTTEMKELK